MKYWSSGAKVGCDYWASESSLLREREGRTEAFLSAGLIWKLTFDTEVLLLLPGALIAGPAITSSRLVSF
jgi:hypothetical protein